MKYAYIYDKIEMMKGRYRFMKLLIITRGESDLSALLSERNETDIVSFDAARDKNLDEYGAIALLGGTECDAVIPNAYLRERLESFVADGKKLFTEFVGSFACVYSAQPKEMPRARLALSGDNAILGKKGDLLDSRCNAYVRPHFLMPETKVLMYYHDYTPAHDRLTSDDVTSDNAAVFEYGNVLSVAFRMCNYLKASFAPKARWDALVRYICGFLGIEPPEKFPASATVLNISQSECFKDALDSAISRSTSLLESLLVTPNGENGIYEGLSNSISPNGERVLIKNVRTDCTGEAAGVLLFSGDERRMNVGRNMYKLCYGPLMQHGGEFDGMVRWSEEAYYVCYQDDVARAIMPSMLYCYFNKSDEYTAPATKALEFLESTTCKDGLRPARTDVLEYLRSGESVYSLKDNENGYASAHYNAYYSAVLLLGYLLTGNERFKSTGIKGLETLMSLYPETVREHSETSELCRLILPLSLLYAVTKQDSHKEMLYRVFNDLLSHKHKNGGYCEYDTGYKAACFNNANGECSLLSQNGDPVADLLYSLNWLPLGFAFAYYATEDERFFEAWKDICSFFIKTQILSEDKLLNGGWCRGIDLDRLEYCGVPHDVGWGPNCIESGWTVAEITLGMQVGKVIFKDMPF